MLATEIERLNREVPIERLVIAGGVVEDSFVALSGRLKKVQHKRHLSVSLGEYTTVGVWLGGAEVGSMAENRPFGHAFPDSGSEPRIRKGRVSRA